MTGVPTIFLTASRKFETVVVLDSFMFPRRGNSPRGLLRDGQETRKTTNVATRKASNETGSHAVSQGQTRAQVVPDRRVNVQVAADGANSGVHRRPARKAWTPMTPAERFARMESSRTTRMTSDVTTERRPMPAVGAG